MKTLSLHKRGARLWANRQFGSIAEVRPCGLNLVNDLSGVDEVPGLGEQRADFSVAMFAKTRTSQIKQFRGEVAFDPEFSYFGNTAGACGRITFPFVPASLDSMHKDPLNGRSRSCMLLRPTP